MMNDLCYIFTVLLLMPRSTLSQSSLFLVVVLKYIYAMLLAKVFLLYSTLYLLKLKNRLMCSQINTLHIYVQYIRIWQLH